MFSSIRVMLLAVAPLVLRAQIEIPAEFQAKKPEAAKRRAGLAEPLWRMTAGKQLLGAKAHLVVELAAEVNSASRAELEREGVRLVRGLGDGAYVASIDLNSTLGKDLMGGDAQRATRLGVRAIAGVSEEDKLEMAIRRGAAPAFATETGAGDRGDFVVTYYPDVDHEEVRREFARLGIRVMEDSAYFQRFTLRIEAKDLKSLARLDWIEFVEAAPAPPKTSTNSASAALVGTNVLQGADFGLKGAGVSLGIIDSGSLAPHVDFGDRLVNVDRATASLHSTHVAGTMAGSGLSNPELRGMAPEARIFSWTFQGDTAAKMLNGINNNQMVVSQNSWGEFYGEFNGGCQFYGAYGTRERDYDRLVREQKLNIFFAAANERDTFDCSIQPRGGTYTIPRPATAKNIVTVGAVDREKAIADFSSYGPVRDERVKPDIVALGVDVLSTRGTNASVLLSGTSMSTPAVSGTAGLLIERFRQKNDNANPPAALVKGALLNTAEDLGNPGPDYAYGYGLLKATEAVKVIDDKLYVSDKVSATERTKSHKVEVAEGAKALRVMLVYSDADAALATGNAIMNHLDLVVTSPDGQRRVLPLRPNPRQPFAAAAPREGARDTVKQVVIDQPAAGAWTAEVKSELQTPEQEYVVTWTTAENPLPPCTYVPTPEFQLLSEKGDAAIVTVTAGAHCPEWTLQNVPDWLRPVGGATRKGSDLVKLGASENTGSGPRTVRLRVGEKTVQVVQNFPCTTEVATIGQPMRAELTSLDCFFDTEFYTYGKYFTFDASQGQAVNVSAQSTAFDTVLYLLAPNGDVIAANDDAGFATTNSRIPANGNLILPVTGKYTAVVTSFDERETGAFQVQVNLVNGQYGAAPAPKSVNGCPGTVTGEITDNSSRYGRRGDLFPTDVIVFPGRAGQTVNLEITNSGFDTILYLVSPSGALQATSTDLDGSGKARLSAVLTSSGQWTVEVAPFSAFSRGSYSLRLEGCTTP